MRVFHVLHPEKQEQRGRPSLALEHAALLDRSLMLTLTLRSATICSSKSRKRA